MYTIEKINKPMDNGRIREKIGEEEEMRSQNERENISVTKMYKSGYRGKGK